MKTATKTSFLAAFVAATGTVAAVSSDDFIYMQSRIQIQDMEFQNTASNTAMMFGGTTFDMVRLAIYNFLWTTHQARVWLDRPEYLCYNLW